MSLQLIKDVLIEELDRKIKAKQLFEERLKDTYKYGHIEIKTIDNIEYLYVYHEEKNKCICVGEYSKEKEFEYKKIIKLRKTALENLESVNSDIPVLQQMIGLIRK